MTEGIAASNRRSSLEAIVEGGAENSSMLATGNDYLRRKVACLTAPEKLKWAVGKCDLAKNM